MYEMRFWKNLLLKKPLLTLAGASLAGLAAVLGTTAVMATDSPGPLHTPSRVVVGEADKTGLRLVLYQYQTCPFCCKVRAYLDYHGLSYDVVEVNPVFRTQIKFSTWKKVPILFAATNDSEWQQLNESSMIISALHSFLLNKRTNLNEISKCYPVLTHKNDKGKDVVEVLNKYDIMFGDQNATLFDKRPKEDIRNEKQWRQWVDDNLVHTLSPNVYRTPAEALQAFRWFSEVGEWEKHFSWLERLVVIYVGATAMYFIGKRLKKRYSLKEDVRQSLYDACDEWVEVVGHDGPFMGGKTPNLADLAVYGVLSAIEGCDAFSDVLANTKIKHWYTNIQESIMKHNGNSLLK